MSGSEPVQHIEVDYDFCSRTFGIYPCGGSLDARQSRTNLALWSEQIDNAYFTKLQISVGVDATVAPDGLTTAELITDTAVSSIHRISRSFTYTAGQPYTFSMFFKAGTLSNVVMVFPTAPFTTAVRAQFDLAAGAVVGTPTGTPSGYGIQSVGGGWYRCWISKTATAGGAGAIEARLNAGGTDTYTGTLQNLSYWGVQVEIGATMSGYKPTTSATVSASHGGATEKCFNTTETCAFRTALDLEPLTLRFIEPRANLPKGSTWFPCLESVSGSSSTVNLAGANPDLAPLGKRATVSASGFDFPYHDRLVDKYAAERVTGAAQADGIGYKPEDYGTFWTKTRARWPFYAGRPIRRCTGHLVGSTLVSDTVRHFIITDMSLANGSWKVEGKDILDLADDKRVQAPIAVNGVLVAAMTTSDMSLTLSPAGIGDLQYPASGFGTIGSELVQYTRTADAVTILARAVSGTVLATHSIGDSFQPSFSPRRARLDDVIYDLLVNYAKINAAFIDFPAWQAEVGRWGSTVSITADITKPEGVAKLIGELAILGVSIWWDDVNQLIGLKMNRPPDLDVVKSISDRNTLIDLEIEDRDEDRINVVQFFSVISDPTKSATDANNYARQRYIVDVGAVSADEFNDTRVKEIYCRWMNHGDDAAVGILGRRYLQSFVRAPQRLKMLVDVKDDMALADVGTINTRDIRSATGRDMQQFIQIIGRDEKIAGHRVQLTGQAYSFAGKRYAYITDNARPVYTASSDAQKARGAYFAGADGKMSDGTDGYRFI